MINIDYNNCVQCGACTSVCNTNALYINTKIREVNYDSSLCNECSLCTIACPLRAIKNSIK